MTTLTLEDQKKSMFAKKKNKNKTPKKCLCNPFHYWPKLEIEDAEVLQTAFKNVFIREKEKPKIPWKKLAQLPKPIRKQRIEEITRNIPISDELICQRKSIKFGINTVSRSIQNLKITSCVLSGDIESNIIILSVASLALSKNIPVVVMPDLRKLTWELLGFSCSALGIVDPSGDGNPKYTDLNDLIIKYASKFRKPKRFQSEMPVKRVKKDVIHTNNLKKTKKTKTVEVEDVYLYRESNSKRVFVPPSEVEIATKSFCSSSDFIPLNIDNDNQIDYVPAVIQNVTQKRKRST